MLFRSCIANELLKQEVMVKMTNFNTIIDDIFPLADKTEYINALASYQLLIIDDLGVERNSEYALGIIFSVIDRRIRSGRPLIITTNLPLKEIKNETMLDKRRIYDRILEMCTPMYVGGTSKREVIASMKMAGGITFLPNDRYLLENEKFRLYYTAEGDEAHNFIVVVEDNFNN